MGETSFSPIFRGRDKERGRLILVGMGLWDHNGISLSGLKSARAADEVCAELYTSIMPGLSMSHLERRIGKRVTLLTRHDLEEDADRKILRQARNRSVVLLVPGDPLAATTHISLRLRAFELGIKTQIIHSASIFSAAPSLTGLQHYKFGKTVTIPLPREGSLPLSTYDVVLDNLARGLHTLVLLDLNVESGEYLTISEALGLLLKIERMKGKSVFSDERLVIGIAHVGSLNPLVKCGSIKDVMKVDFGAPPHTLIIPGELHFMEAETLVKMFGAPKSILSRETPSS
jgi:diphthine synthase